MKILNVLALTIAIIGAVNWGLIGAFDFNLVDMLFGAGSMFRNSFMFSSGSADCISSCCIRESAETEGCTVRDLPGFFVDPGKKRMKMMDEPLQKKAYMVI